jgi:hypothetical protein
MNEQREYVTADFYLSCFLKARGLKLLDAVREGRRTTFVFEDNDIRKQLVKDFYNDGTVEVNAFKNAIQDLKAIVFNL